MIHADGLTRSFAGRVVVDDVRFRVEPGEVVGFLGPNGAGKTTTLRLLLGLLRPSAGRAEVTRPVGHLPEGFAGYDSAVRLGLRSVVADAPVKGEVSIATTGIGDPAALARVQAGALDPSRALAEAYERFRQPQGLPATYQVIHAVLEKC